MDEQPRYRDLQIPVSETKQILKIITDVFMTAALLLLMAYSLIGEAAHKWRGVSGFLLSRYEFQLDVHSFSAALRTVHMLLAYWGFKKANKKFKSSLYKQKEPQSVPYSDRPGL